MFGGFRIPLPKQDREVRGTDKDERKGRLLGEVETEATSGGRDAGKVVLSLDPVSNRGHLQRSLSVSHTGTAGREKPPESPNRHTPVEPVGYSCLLTHADTHLVERTQRFTLAHQNMPTPTHKPHTEQHTHTHSHTPS